METESVSQYPDDSDSAFANMVRTHTPWVYALARRICGDAHLAEDVVQATFIILHRKSPRFQNEGAMINWLHKVARYAAATAARSERRRRHHQKAGAHLPPQNESSEWQELAPFLDGWIDRLPKPDRQAILLRYYLDLPFTDVGVQLNCSSEAAHKRVDRALEKLRGFAGRNGIVLSAELLAINLGEQIRISPPPGLVARSCTAAPPGSALGHSSQTIVKGVMHMMTGKTAALVASIFFATVIGGGAVWMVKAAGPAEAPISTIQSAPPRYARLAPFSAIRWSPEVFVRGQWYTLKGIDNISVDRIVDFIRQNYGDGEVQKRFDQDLVEVLTRMGHPPGVTVSLNVTVPMGGGTRAVSVLTDVPMTEANRQQIMAVELNR